jgi:hypothetical protein
VVVHVRIVTEGGADRDIGGLSGGPLRKSPGGDLGSDYEDAPGGQRGPVTFLQTSTYFSPGT